MTVIYALLISIWMDFSVGTRIEIFYISMRCLMDCHGGDMYDSEDSEWDDPYALASAAYVEDIPHPRCRGAQQRTRRLLFHPTGCGRGTLRMFRARVVPRLNRNDGVLGLFCAHCLG